jgi:hypothetical protein
MLGSLCCITLQPNCAEKTTTTVTITKPYNLNTTLVEGKNRSNSSSNRGNWNHPKSFRKYLNAMPGKYEIKKTDILGTAHLLWKVLM